MAQISPILTIMLSFLSCSISYILYYVYTYYVASKMKGKQVMSDYYLDI